MGVAAAVLEIAGEDGPGWWVFVPICSMVALIAAHMMRLPGSVEFQLGRTTVEIAAGDLFEQDGHLVIPANEYLDHKLGDHVSPKSVHGQLINRIYAGESDRFRADVERGLREAGIAPIDDGTVGSPLRYEIGATAVIDQGPRRLFVTALSHSRLSDKKASADVDDLWRTLRKLWPVIHGKSNGQSVSLPLVGDGLAQVPLNTTEDILRLILLSISADSVTRSITPGGVRIILTNDALRQLDLRKLGS